MAGDAATPRGRWGRLAARLGLAVVERRWFLARRIRALVGQRHGYLVCVSPGHGINSSSVDVLVRHPRETVHGLREDLLGDPRLAAAFGRRRRVPRTRRRNLLTGDGAVLMRLTYAFFPPRNARVELVVDGLIEALGDRLRALERKCEICEYDRDPLVCLADGVPGYYCQACLDQFQEEESKYTRLWRSLEPDYPLGLGVGLSAMLALGLTGGALVAVVGLVTRSSPHHALLAPLFAVIGYLVSSLASRGLCGTRLGALMARLPFSLAAAVVAWTAMHAITSMTLRPGAWTFWFLLASGWGAALAAPQAHAWYIGAAAAGWAAEVAWTLVAHRRRLRRTDLVVVAGA
jgi:hypothetical protein